MRQANRTTIFGLVGLTLGLVMTLSNTHFVSAMFQSPLPLSTVTAMTTATLTATATATVTWTPTPTVSPTPTMGPPQLFPSALCGQVGETVMVEGVNFGPNAIISLTWSGFPLGTSPSPVQVDPAGRFSFSFIIPNDFVGPHLVRASDGLRLAQFTLTLGQTCAPPPPTATPTAPVSPTPTNTAYSTLTPPAETPRLSCGPEAALPEQTITVSGQNFHPGGHFHQLRWDGVPIPWAPNGLTVGDDGAFTLWFNAPSDSYELHMVTADDGKGGVAVCYLDLLPRDPTPTWTPTPTLTPTPTATWTPGLPPRITVTPTLEPSPFEYCLAAEAVFTRDPLVDSRIEAGAVLTNTNLAWPDGRVQLGLWQYYRLQESDTGVRFTLPALGTGEAMTLRQPFQASQYAGPVWFQLRLIDSLTGQVSVCTSAWFGLHIVDDEPYAPPLLEPSDNVWLNSRDLSLDWLAAAVPAGAGPIDGYEVHLLDLAGGDLLAQSVGPEATNWEYQLAADYGARQLAWRARAHNVAGWGRWATAFYFGVDTVPPQVDIALAGTPGQADWWRSPLTVRLGGSDPAPGSGLTATYLQAGDGRWEQVIPGGANRVDREGEYLIRAYGRDQALNRSSIVIRPVRVDLEAPHNLNVIFSAEPTSSGWYTAPITIGLMAADTVSGVGERRLRVSGGPWQLNEISLATAGAHTVEFMARDIAGNDTDLRQTTARLDLSPPAGMLALNGSLCQGCSPATISISAGDDDSGLAHWTLGLRQSEVSPATLLPSAETVLASGSDPEREVDLNGGELPVGRLVLRLAVQDRAGWLTVRELVLDNAPAPVGPTPTAWVMVTATPWPSPTPDALPYSTITPTPVTYGGGGGGDDNDGDSGGGGGTGEPPGSGEPGLPPAGYYPVAGTAVPAILPVTGVERLSKNITRPYPGLDLLIGMAATGLLVWLVRLTWPNLIRRAEPKGRKER